MVDKPISTNDMNNTNSLFQPKRNDKTFCRDSFKMKNEIINQAIVFDSINNIKQIEYYVTPISKIIPAEDIQFLSRTYFK